MSHDLEAIRQFVGDRSGYWMDVRQCATLRDLIADAAYAQAIEDAAKVCDARIGRLMDEGSGREEIEWRDHEAAQCRDAIRALATKATP